MKKIARFFKNLSRSLFDLEFYQELLKTPISFSFKYLYFLLYLILLVNTLLFLPNLFQLKKEIPQFIKTVQTTSKNFYPEELVVNIKDGALSTNVKEPYAIPLPKELMTKGETSELKNLVVIDTQANPENFKKYATAVLITKKSFVYPKEDKYEVYPMENIKQNVKIDKNIYENFLNKIIGYVNLLPKFIPLAMVTVVLLCPFIGAGLDFAGRLLILVFYTLIPFLFAKIFKKNLSFGKTFQIAIHCSTLIIVANFLFGLLAKISNLLKLTAVNQTMVEVIKAFGKAEFWVFLIWICFVIYKIKTQPAKK